MDGFEIDQETEDIRQAQLWLNELISAGHVEEAESALFELVEKLLIKPDQAAWEERERRIAQSRKSASAPNAAPIFG